MKLLYCFFVTIIISSLCCCNRAEKEPTVLDNIIAEFSGQLDDETGVSIPGTVVIVIKDGMIYHRQAFGYKDMENKDAMSVDSIFQVASLSKTVCALGIMKAIEEGWIALDDPVENYLTRWHIPDSDYQTQNVTFRRLLSHTAGLSVRGYAGIPPGIGLPSIEQSLLGNHGTIYSELYSDYHNEPVMLEREPGEMWNYSGGGYTVLQLAVEEITKNSFQEFMDATVLKKMKMGSSSYTYYSGMGSQLAKPYDSSLVQLPNFLFTEVAAAGLYTTADDLANMFIEMIKCYHGEDNYFILNRDTLSLMLTAEAPIDEVQSMGLGFVINNIGNGKKTYSHNGANQGWTALYEFSLDTKEGIIILTNGYYDMADKLLSPFVIAWREYIVNQ